MIWIEDQDHPNGFPHPKGLSAIEAAELDCEFWAPKHGSSWDIAPDGLEIPTVGQVNAPGCRGFGHYLCGECASHAEDDDDAG
jgi:hypothetical protein